MLFIFSFCEEMLVHLFYLVLYFLFISLLTLDYFVKQLKLLGFSYWKGLLIGEWVLMKESNLEFKLEFSTVLSAV